MDPLKVGEYMANKKAYLNGNMVDNEMDLSTIDNTVLIKHAMNIFDSPAPDLSKPEQVKNAIDNYFNSCIEKNIRPGNLGLYAALDLDKRQVFELVNGRIKLGASLQSIELIKKAIKALSLYRELLGSTNKLSAPVLIFWQKNYDGLTDEQKIEIAMNNNMQPEMTTDEIRQQIENDIPIDTDYREIE